MNSNLRFILAALIFGFLALLFSIFIFFEMRSSEGGETELPPEGGSFGSLAPREGTSPIGGGGGTTTPPTGETPAEERPFEEKRLPALRVLSWNPVAGATYYTDGRDLKIRFMERGNAHIYDTFPRKEEWYRISRMTIPKVYEAIWYGNGSSTLLRLLDESTGVSENFAAQVVRKSGEPTGDGDYQLQGSFLERGIGSITLLQEGRGEIAYLTPGSVSIVSTLANGSRAPQKRYELLGSEWQLSWPTKSKIFATTNASAAYMGYLYAFEGSAKEPKRILEGMGLTTLVSPKGKYVLYTTSKDKTFDLYVLNTETGTSQQLPVRTLPEKCVWISEESFSVYCAVPNIVHPAEYPDSWYRGQLHFYDVILRINMSSNTVLNIADYAVLERSMDITNLNLTEDGTYLMFENKIDGRLWGLDLAAL